ncbi:MFS general substrate transporter [Mytilinidion resinicola]|uniref:MFS general substrate transporter n=1 Tax=Mytilinidion resinicola TaxID=574789 RepID=A0A6A6Z803_9PEZI|nr:MFS general substrate transporter [Mytilinidion resinicola]KAF2816839.1 MFS general substrate transporter [Mytilinidion resinicola]
MKLALIMVSLFLSAFLAALDRTILATAIPKITDDFNSIGDIGWYASAFLLTGCSFMLFFGKLYTLYDIKWIFLTCIVIFEAGSAICGAAPTSNTLIAGRAVAGLGSAGMFSGIVIMGTHIVPLRKRPLFQAVFGAVFGISSVIGPLLGGAFADRVSWRWCFYINLPIGGVTIVILMLFLKINFPVRAKEMSYRQQLNELDPLGTIIFLPACVSLLLALKWGGTEKPWNNRDVIACLVLSVVLFIAFIIVQCIKGEIATVPPRIIKQRSIAAGLCYSTCSGGALLIMVFYVPIWFQSVRGVSAVHSGIDVIAMVLSLSVGAPTGGIFTFKTGYYVPCMFASTIIASIGAGLITTWDVDTSRAKWIAYQFLFGYGFGIGMQQPNMAAQTVLHKKDVPIGSSLIFFGQSLGGTIFVSVGQTIFTNTLKDNLMAIGGLSVAAILKGGATNLKQIVPPEKLAQVLVGYNDALIKTFYAALALVCAGIVGAATMEWKSIKKGEGQFAKKGAESGPKETGPQVTTTETEKV